jgi:plasmid stabilization system protein ParE
MILEFHPAARDEFLAAAEYYETAVPGLGGRFLVAVTRATDIVLQHPDVGGRRGARARQLIVTGFPYDVVYMVHDDVVSILAVAHHHRRPGYWRDRLNG